MKEEKQCTRCKEVKKAAEFTAYTRRGNSYKELASRCIICVNEHRRLNYNSEETCRKAKIYRDKPENKERRNASRKVFRENNIGIIMYEQAKTRAKSKGIEFNIEKSDVIIPEFCPILNIRLKRGEKWNSPSLDRIDNNKGYVKGNILVISDVANTMKNRATLEMLMTFCENAPKVYAPYLNKNND